MYVKYFIALILFVVLGLNLFAGTVTPNTTLAIETGNNTSAADSFDSQSNGNLGATNISKVDIRSLLYPGATTRIFTHWMPWFGPSYHMNVGYDSSDPAQVRRQVDDMMSRGIQGAIVDWYGPSSTHHNTATINLMRESETRNGQFFFAITEDGGALKSCAATSGCDLTQKLISDLTYVYKTFEPSPAYARIGGRPLVFFFSIEQYGSINWSTVAANVPGNPLFIFRNSGGFSHSYSGGSFAWVGIASDSTSWGQSYLDNFYSVALRYPGLHSFASAYKGFNDTLASWGKNRIVNQHCGQTWLNSLKEIGKYYSAANQAESLQLVTWNDYEEGTELETGIDNCVTVTASISGSTLSWNISGNENTLDHYTVFISADGQNLMKLAEIPVGAPRTLDLASFGFDTDQYTLLVKAVGQPSMRNHVSGPVTYSSTNQPPQAALTVTPSTGTAPLAVTASTSGSSDPDGGIASVKIDFGDGASANAASASHTYSTPGSYTVKATVTDKSGATASATKTVTAAAPTTAYGVTVTSPAAGATVGSPVHVVASATSSKPITLMRIYLDYQRLTSVRASKLDAYVTMTPGDHHLTVQAWDSDGNVYRNPCWITVK